MTSRTTSESVADERASAIAGAVGNISLCLSGGGFRAVGFHLGTVEYLDRVGLLGNVKAISTVSGGTFVGARWIVSIMEGRSFDDYFGEYYEFNDTADLMALAFEHLRAGRPATPSGRNALAVAMASVHADTIARAPDGQPYRFGAVLDADLPIDEIVFNTTELRNGLAFAFRKSRDPNAVIGNHRLAIRKEDAADIRLADIIMSSSCFPGGFEPFAFPDDFVWPENEPPTALRKQFSRAGSPHPVAFVDGCVYDNQGIETLLLEDSESTDVDMAIISDTDQRFEEIYPVPRVAAFGEKIRLRQVLQIARVLGGLVVLGSAAIAVRFGQHINEGTLPMDDLFVYVLPLFFGGIITLGLLWLRRTVRRIASAGIPEVSRTIWNGLKEVRFYEFLDMLKLRLGVMRTINEKFYAKRVRELVYTRVYELPKYGGKLVSNRIFELMPDAPWSTELPGDVPRPSRDLERVADVAATLGTNLWFEHDYELPCLVAAGQATLCYNLMIWVVRRHGDEPTRYAKPVRELWNRLTDDWAKVCANPYALLEERLPDKKFPRPSR